eukprot:COSAG01_NODE_1458_length_10252_cov_247.726288_4_plen_71_part_00
MEVSGGDGSYFVLMLANETGVSCPDQSPCCLTSGNMHRPAALQAALAQFFVASMLCVACQSCSGHTQGSH